MKKEEYKTASIMQISERVKGHIYVLLTNTMFGIFIPISKYLLRDCVSPLFVTMCRFFGATALFWLASVFVRDNKPTPRDLLWFFFFALTGIVMNQGLFMFALKYTSPIDASVILTATPFAALFASAIFMRDPITRRKLLGVAIGASGAVWLVTSASGGASAIGSGSVGGDLIVLFTTFSAAVYIVLSKPLTLKYSAITIMKWMFLFASLMFLPLLPSTISSPDAIKTNLGIFDICAMAYVIVGATFCTYLLMNMGIKRIRPTTVAMYIYVQPVVSSAVAICVGQDCWSWGKLFASLLVFAGVYIVTTSARTPAQLEFARKVENQSEL